MDEPKTGGKKAKVKQKYDYPVRPLRFPVVIRSVIQAVITFTIYSIIIWVLLSQKSATDRITFAVNGALERTALATLALDVQTLEEIPFGAASRQKTDFLDLFRENLLKSAFTPGPENIELSLIVKRDGKWLHYLSTQNDWIDKEWDEGEFMNVLPPGKVFGNMMDEQSYESQHVTPEIIQSFVSGEDLDYIFIQFQVADKLSDFFIENGRKRQYDFTDARLVYLVIPEGGSPILLDQAFFIGRYLLLSFLFILPIIIFASYRITSRARSLRETIIRVAKGDFTARSNIIGKDEVGQLSDHINGLARALEQRQKLQSAVNLASQLQKDLLPPEPPCPKELGYQIAQANEMSNEVGGDFFDYKCDENHLYIVIGDISGHGLESGLMMSASRTAIRVYLDMDLQPKELAERLNHQLYEDLIQGHFLTAAILHLELNTGKWWHLSCGHEPTLVREQGQIRQLGTTCPPLGMFPKISVKKDVERGTIEPGDTILLTTDGLRECADAQDIQLGHAFMREELATAEDPYILVDHLVEHARKHRKPLPMEDDITIVAIKRPKN